MTLMRSLLAAAVVASGTILTALPASAMDPAPEIYANALNGKRYFKRGREP